jgi:aminotransferase
MWPFTAVGRRARQIDAPKLALGQGQPDFDTPQHIKDAMNEALRMGYTGYRGVPELVNSLVKKFKEDNNIDVKPSQIIVTVGASEAVLIGLLALIQDGDECIITDPAYVSYKPLVEFTGAKAVPVPMREDTDYQLDIEVLNESITPRTKLIFFNSPNNPTGTVLTRDNLKAIAEIAVDNDLLVISDEVYEKLIFGEAKHFSIASLPGMYERTITMNSFSKTYAMTGWRVGYMTGPQKLISSMAKLHSYGFICNNPAVMYAANAALTGPQDCVEEMVEEYAARRELIEKKIEEIPGMNVRGFPATFYVFPNISEYGVSSWDFCFELVDNCHIVSIPGAPFGEQGEGHLRFSYATSRQTIVEAMERIKKYVEEKYF